MKTSPVTRLLAPLWAAILLLAGCGGGDPVAPEGQGGIQPLALGDQWMGRWEEFPSDGSSRPVRLDTTTITGSVSYQGDTWWYAGSSTIAMMNFNDGLWAMTGDIERDSTLQFYHMRIFPAIVGDTARLATGLTAGMQGDPADTRVTVMTVEAIDRQITVPAGTFACYGYSERIVAADADSAAIAAAPIARLDYYAPGVGRVRSDIFEQSPHQGTRLTRRWELTEFYLNP
jgi:hypothetical protein